MAPESIIAAALARIQGEHYAAPAGARLFFRDRRALLGALTWPAKELHERGVPIAAARYQHMLTGLLDGIREHGDAAKTAEYFPAYLKRCIQSHWQHHWEAYYEDGKRLRNQFDALVRRAGAAVAAGEEDRTAEILAAAHTLVAPGPRRRPTTGSSGQGTGPDDRQLDLFG